MKPIRYNLVSLIKEYFYVKSTFFTSHNVEKQESLSPKKFREINSSETSSVKTLLPSNCCQKEFQQFPHCETILQGKYLDFSMKPIWKYYVISVKPIFGNVQFSKFNKRVKSTFYIEKSCFFREAN